MEQVSDKPSQVIISAKSDEALKYKTDEQLFQELVAALEASDINGLDKVVQLVVGERVNVRMPGKEDTLLTSLAVSRR